MFYEPGRSLAKITIRLMVFIITAASLQAAEVSLGAGGREGLGNRRLLR